MKQIIHYLTQGVSLPKNIYALSGWVRALFSGYEMDANGAREPIQKCLKPRGQMKGSNLRKLFAGLCWFRCFHVIQWQESTNVALSLMTFHGEGAASIHPAAAGCKARNASDTHATRLCVLEACLSKHQKPFDYFQWRLLPVLVSKGF